MVEEGGFTFWSHCHLFVMWSFIIDRIYNEMVNHNTLTIGEANLTFTIWAI